MHTNRLAGEDKGRKVKVNERDRLTTPHYPLEVGHLGVPFLIVTFLFHFLFPTFTELFQKEMNKDGEHGESPEASDIVTPGLKLSSLPCRRVAAW
ncbi:hypothetical protein EYF80_017513 [Liparis tanakae]|uniref:Uncharacterized protein n=1 Tax=Liparis tanakae TaxID=230148 RepID=A0A4Z2I2C3_9TELE|nr:hypothetical protein EYF80_017513 [Liparis tanakae]